MIFRQLAAASQITVNMAAVSAGTSDTQTGTEVDMFGFDSVCFIAMIGTITSTGVATLTAKNSDTSSTYGSGTVDSLTDPISGSVVSASLTTGDSGKVMVLDIHRPPRRYVRAQIARATANVVITGMVAILYNSHVAPVSELAANGVTSTVSSPIPSTA